jgi:hypothetical protein
MLESAPEMMMTDAEVMAFTATVLEDVRKTLKKYGGYIRGDYKV